MTRPRRFVVVLGAAAVAVGGCGGDALAGAGVTVADSAGVRVVRFVDLDALDLSDRPLSSVVEIGREDGAELYRVAAARLLGSGRIAVGNGGTGEILYFEPDGALALRAGREGDGPGEFRAVTSLPDVAGDTLTVYDVRLGRLTVLDPAGEVVDTRPLPPPSRAVDLLPLAVGPDGRVLAVHGEARIFAMGGVLQDTSPLLAIDPPSTVDTLGLWAAKEWSFGSMPGGAFRTEVAFGRSLAASGRDGRVVVGSTGRLDLEVVEAPDRTVLRIEGTDPNRPVPGADVAAWRAERESRYGDEVPERVRAAIEAAPYNETYPAFEGVLLDADGRIWIGEAPSFGAAEKHWTVLAPDGIPRFRVMLPVDAEPLDARGDRVVVLTRTELDEEVVRVMEIGTE